jgi:hypothetical protein
MERRRRVEASMMVVMEFSRGKEPLQSIFTSKKARLMVSTAHGACEKLKNLIRATSH